MIITKKALPRRTILRGLGVTLALPWLESMVPALTALSRSAAAPARRFGVFYVPNGMSMGYWSPESEGAIDKLPPILETLEAHKDRVLMVGGLNSDPATKVIRAGAHARSSGVFLNCVPFSGSEADVVAGTTMDQLAAKQFGQETQIASLELGIEVAGVARRVRRRELRLDEHYLLELAHDCLTARQRPPVCVRTALRPEAGVPTLRPGWPASGATAAFSTC